MKRNYLILILLLISFCLNGQGFRINDGQKKFSMKFQHLGNLVIVPLSINGSKPLNFILDTGSPYTIITNLDIPDDLKLSEGKKIFISGLGNNEKPIEGYYSSNNSVKIGDAICDTNGIVILFEKEFDLSGRFGIPIYGIIGYDIFKDFVIEVNYSQRVVHFYLPEYFYKNKSKKLRKFEELNIEIEDKKPYILTNTNIDGKNVPLRLLIDSGNWEALWLFEDEKVQIPQKYITDYMGFGLSGEVHGKKSRISYIQIGSLKLEKPTTSFPDTLSTKRVIRANRNGTIGSEILKRFNTIYDYTNLKLYVKKNRNYDRKFHFNMAGMELYQPYPNLPYLEVAYVRENSPAALAGIRKGDAIKYINDKKIGLFSPIQENETLSTKKIESISLDEIMKLFKEKAGRKINVVYTRGNELMERSTSFVLEESI